MTFLTELARIVRTTKLAMAPRSAVAKDVAFLDRSVTRVKSRHTITVSTALSVYQGVALVMFARQRLNAWRRAKPILIAQMSLAALLVTVQAILRSVSKVSKKCLICASLRVSARQPAA